MQKLVDDPTGRTLAGRYDVLKPLGEESLGQVYVGRDRQKGALVQVKVLEKELAADPERFARFGREITASFMVSHPNTVEVFDYGDDDGCRYLVQEYLVGHPLRVELAKGPLSIERAVWVAAQVASAIGAAHQEGIFHRALSPDTVLLLENARGVHVKVRDFGMSKLEPQGESGELDDELTSNEVRLGDAAGMPPEYIDTGRFQTKGDLYALGVLLFTMIAGRPPFQGDRSSVLIDHVQKPAPRLSSVAADVPPWLDTLVAELLSKKPGERPGAYKVVQRLEEGVGHGLAPAPLVALDADGNPIEKVEPEPEPAAGAPRWVLGVLALVVFGGLAGGAVLVAAATILGLVLTLPT